MQTYSVEVTRVIAAPRQRVFEAFLDAHADVMRHFAPTGPDGRRMDLRLHRFEPIPGGALEYSMVPAGGPDAQGHRIVGSFLAIEDGRKIVRTEAPPGGPETTVTFLFEDAPGGTQVTIRHDGIPDAGWAAGAKHGWDSALQNLAAAWATREA